MDNSKNQIEILSENQLDESLVKKIKELLGKSFDVEAKVDISRFKQKIEVTSARPIDQGILDQIKKIFGDNIEIITKVDEKVIGGIKIRTREKLYDGTIKGQLNKLRNNL